MSSSTTYTIRWRVHPVKTKTIPETIAFYEHTHKKHFGQKLSTEPSKRTFKLLLLP